MRQVASRSLLLLAAILSQPLVTQASPFPVQFANFILHDRACENPCGYYGQLCCSASETCATRSNGQAACLANVEQRDGSGQWEYYTTTFVQTDYVTVTSTGSKWITAPTTGTGQCSPSLGETECGQICCSAAQTCDSPGTCVGVGNSPIETGPSPTPEPPLRPTATTGETVPPTPPPTGPFIPPVDPDTGDSDSPENSDGEDEGLSGGAIAGIVIGALAGSALLLLLCCCLCVGSCVDRARGLLGLKGGSRSSSYTGSSSRSPHRTWFGAGPARPKPKKDKKKSGMFGMATIGLILGAMAIFLGLKKKNRGRSEKSDSYYTGSSYYTYSSYDSSSSSSSSSSSGPRRPNRGR